MRKATLLRAASRFIRCCMLRERDRGRAGGNAASAAGTLGKTEGRGDGGCSASFRRKSGKAQALRYLGQQDFCLPHARTYLRVMFLNSACACSCGLAQAATGRNSAPLPVYGWRRTRAVATIPAATYWPLRGWRARCAWLLCRILWLAGMRVPAYAVLFSPLLGRGGCAARAGRRRIALLPQQPTFVHACHLLSLLSLSTCAIILPTSRAAGLGAATALASGAGALACAPAWPSRAWPASLGLAARPTTPGQLCAFLLPAGLCLLSHLHSPAVHFSTCCLHGIWRGFEDGRADHCALQRAGRRRRHAVPRYHTSPRLRCRRSRCLLSVKAPPLPAAFMRAGACCVGAPAATAPPLPARYACALRIWRTLACYAHGGGQAPPAPLRCLCAAACAAPAADGAHCPSAPLRFIGTSNGAFAYPAWYRGDSLRRETPLAGRRGAW